MCLKNWRWLKTNNKRGQTKQKAKDRRRENQQRRKEKNKKEKEEQAQQTEQVQEISPEVEGEDDVGHWFRRRAGRPGRRRTLPDGPLLLTLHSSHRARCIRRLQPGIESTAKKLSQESLNPLTNLHLIFEQSFCNTIHHFNSKCRVNFGHF